MSIKINYDLKESGCKVHSITSQTSLVELHLVCKNIVKSISFEDGASGSEKALRGAVSARWAVGAAASTALLLLLAAAAERRLPAPRRASPDADAFDGYRAHAHLVNLTAIGARVAGSYENEVLAVRWAVQALRQVAAHASPHNSLEIDVHSASGAFPLTFLDGMNNVYRDVQSVVARARGRGGETSSARRTARPTRTALLINCHYDTVPGSPGASDDGAGCAVALEALRALLAAPRPLRHDLVLLLNGAEENILQASHAFITTHKYLAWGAACVVAASAALAASGGARAAYSGERPQRVLLFHTRRTDHARAPPSVDNFFWIPEIDANTPHSLVGYVEGVESARAGGAAGEEECSRWVYCGAPYYLPVRRLIARGHSLPARSSPRTRLQVAAHRRRLNDTTAALHLHIRGPQHVVVVVAPAEGALLRWSSVLARPLEGPRWGLRRTYFLSVHHARAPANMHLELHVQHEEVEVEGEAGGQVAQLSVAGHSMFGEDALSEEHQQLLERLPPWTAPFGWGVDLHLFAL
ncbi:Endoplasmic reticulum metallopeptidase 1 [Papilio machaon]|uniref:Endoplasmic reticulum metallopeptidase 1 n=1 Tax=Papilio machaon TaxID=76193 RepID=A0A0N1INJ8_PAPMA|nr:Endoplasmic reticulum metallopeptidase 1 [Papilio machaon]